MVTFKLLSVSSAAMRYGSELALANPRFERLRLRVRIACEFMGIGRDSRAIAIGRRLARDPPRILVPRPIPLRSIGLTHCWEEVYGSWHYEAYSTILPSLSVQVTDGT